MKKILFNIIWIITNFLSRIYLFFNLSKNNIIIFSSLRYNDNSRYLFEYISRKKTPYKIIWITNNFKIKNYLDKKKLLCAHSFFHQLHYISLAKIAIFSGGRFEDRYNFLNNNTIKFCLNHGVGPKITLRGKTLKDNIEYLKGINNVDYSNFTSRFTEHVIGRLIYKLPSKKILSLGYPRNDHLFYKSKTISQRSLINIYKDLKINFEPKKLILFSPTWRERNKDYNPLSKIKNFKFSKLNNFLYRKKFLLICTTHPNSKYNFSGNFENIKFINLLKFPLFDVNLILPKVDMLITDYSTISTDFAILKKPQLFLLNDFKSYFKEESLIEDFRKIMPGREVKTFQNLIKELSKKNYKLNNKIFLEKYYDTKNKNSNEKHFQFLNRIIKK